jgi:hypothetical protein
MTMPRGTLLAEDARTATTSAGPCAICGSPILHGHYIARLLSGCLAHTLCIGRATWRQAAR